MTRNRSTSKLTKSAGTALAFCVLSLLAVSPASAQEGEQWISFEPGTGPGDGQHIVLISGDEEYRSEETLPMLAKILSEHHGFRTTVLFAIDPETGEIDPDEQTNIPGMENLTTADLVVLFTRFRELPDEQMAYFDAYLQSGGPFVALRTATHAFNYTRNPESPFAKYSYGSEVPGWEGGFGRQILGETWIDHHGRHSHEGTRGLIDGVAEDKEHPVLLGVEDVWGVTNVYRTRELEGDPDILLWGQPTAGLTPDASVNWRRSIMPVAWTREYTSEEGNTGRVFATTMGSAMDVESEGLRRLLVNAVYWGLNMEELIPEANNVEIVGDYEPTMFGFGDYREGMRPSDYR
jgi:hypothetical protein